MKWNGKELLETLKKVPKPKPSKEGYERGLKRLLEAVKKKRQETKE